MENGCLNALTLDDFNGPSRSLLNNVNREKTQILLSNTNTWT